jgi:hypothetical protein
VRIEFTTASRKHRIGRAHVRYVMAMHKPEETVTTRGERGWKYVDVDDRGVELEVIAVELDGGDLLGGARDADGAAREWTKWLSGFLRRSRRRRRSAVTWI